MFRLKVADLVFHIDNSYDWIRNHCQNYIDEQAQSDVFISLTREEIIVESHGDERMHLGYRECLAAYRKIANAMISFDGFLMHSAVIDVDGEGVAFAAASGTGKTTHMRLWMQEFDGRVKVVNGDKPICRFVDGTLYAYGTPWMGKEQLGNNMRTPLKALCFIERGDKNSIRSMGQGEVIGRLFHQLLMPEDEESLDHFMSLIDRMLESVDFYLLTCNMDPEAAHVAYEGIFG